MLVADLVGVGSRSTVDMDLTIKSFSLTRKNTTEVFYKNTGDENRSWN